MTYLYSSRSIRVLLRFLGLNVLTVHCICRNAVTSCSPSLWLRVLCFFSRVVVRFWSLLDLYVLKIRTEDFVRLLADENCVVPFCFFRILVCGRDASVLCCSAGHHERHSLVLPFKLMVTTKEVFPSYLIKALRVSCPAPRSLFTVEYKSGEKATIDWCRNLVVRWLSRPAIAGLKLFLELLYSYSIQAKSSHLLYLLPVIYHIYISLDRKIDFFSYTT